MRMLIIPVGIRRDGERTPALYESRFQAPCSPNDVRGGLTLVTAPNT
jgi:hypothetical protein